MLVIARRPGERLQIDDIVMTVERIAQNQAEISFRKRQSAPIRLTLQAKQFVEGCYNVRVGLVATERGKARLGFEVPEDIKVWRL